MPFSEGSLLFAHDVQSDPLISRYGSLDRSTVPSYRRGGKVRVLGAKGCLVVHEDGAQNTFSIKSMSVLDSIRRGSKRYLACVARVKARRLIIESASEDVFENAQNYISIRSTHKHRRCADGSEDDSKYEENGPSYRSIYGKASADDFVDSDVDSLNETSSLSIQKQDTPALYRSQQIKQQLNEHPDAASAWLELVALQDEVFRELKQDTAELTEAERKSQAEIKIDMLQKALKHSHPKDKAKLHASLMREGMKVWDYQVLSKRWKAIASNDDDDFILYLLRLEFLLGHGKSLAYLQMSNFMAERVNLLKKRIVSGFYSDEKCTFYCEQLVYTFLRVTRFTVDMGYVELAVAAWQALLEIHFGAFAKQNCTQDTLEQFWDSEATRFGEDGTQRQKGTPVPAQDIPWVSSKKYEVPKSGDLFTSWALEEDSSLMNGSKMPMRFSQLPHAQDYDPFTTVLFEDLKPFLFEIPLQLRDSMRSLVIDMFLIFCGLPPAFATSELTQMALKDPFLLPCMDTILESVIGRGDQLAAKLEPDFQNIPKAFALSTFTLFAGPDWFSYLPRSMLCTPVDQGWAAAVVRQLVCVYDIEELAEFCLALEWTMNPKGAKAIAKMLLKKFTSNIALYNAYALAELRNGRPELAQKTLSAATRMQVGGSLFLFRSWAWVELANNDKQAAIIRLIQSQRPDVVDSPNPALIVKVSHDLTTKWEFLLSSGLHAKAVETALVSMLLDYLAVPASLGSPAITITNLQGNLAAILSTIHRFNDMFIFRFPNPTISESLSHQRFLQECCRLLYHHARSGPYRPADMHKLVLTFASIYPGNTLLLAMVAWVDSAVAASNPLRAGSLPELLRTRSFQSEQDSPAVRIFAIQHAITSKRSPYAVRAVFEAALTTSDACKGANEIWRLYIRFVAFDPAFQSSRSSSQLIERSKKNQVPNPYDSSYTTNDLVKKVFYRALAECPGVKSLVMEAFFLEPLRQKLDNDELIAVERQMIAWGIRLKSDLEDWLETETDRKVRKAAIVAVSH